MKVRCIKLVNRRGERATSPWLKLNGVYDVLSIYIEKQGRQLVRLIGEQPTPMLASLSEFEIIDGSIPTNWAINATSSGNLDIGPASWNSPGFWERYYDMDREAVEIFREEQQRMNDDKR